MCDRFASAFHLQYDSSTRLYRVNDTVHTELLERNPSLKIALGATSDPQNSVEIELPYRAFDLQASYPIYPNATNYFPIRRADKESQYTLGRVLLQEAYLIVDHDRGNFSIHQARFPATNEKSQIIPILSPEFVANSENTTTKGRADNSHQSSLGKGGIAGISLGATLVTVGLVLLLLFLRKRPRKDKEEKEVSKKDTEETEEGTGIAEVESSGIHELHCTQGELDGTALSELCGTTALYLLSDDAKSMAHEMPAD